MARSTLPPSARVREYTIDLQNVMSVMGDTFRAEPVGATFERFDVFAGVSGNDVGVVFEHFDDESPGIVERLNADTGESFSLLAWTPKSAPYAVPFVTSLSGTVTWCPTPGATGRCVTCESSRHQLTLVR